MSKQRAFDERAGYVFRYNETYTENESCESSEGTMWLD